MDLNVHVDHCWLGFVTNMLIFLVSTDFSASYDRQSTVRYANIIVDVTILHDAL
jgi:hypothetical protein